MHFMTIVSRFAPSPTGILHLGSVRTAFIAYLVARAADGKFILRIDDTDLGRSKDENTESIKRDMTWLDMGWDEYYHQRGREDVYNAARDKLMASGRMYACYETEEELGLKRKVQLAQGKPPIYDRSSLNLSAEQVAKYEAEGRKPHYRFLLKAEPIKWNDHIRGPVELNGKDFSDPVLIREDGSPLYHLCSVVDDIEYGITHVVRGEDHVSNTAFHIQMFEALGSKPPEFMHLPLVFSDEGKKLSKRIDSLSVDNLRFEVGLEPVTMLAFVSRLGTSKPMEPFKTMEEVIAGFDISTFGRANPRFIFDELLRLNAKIVHSLTLEEAKPRLAEFGLDGITEEFWNAARPNLTVLKDIKDWWRVAHGPVTPLIEDADFIKQAADLLPAEPWTTETWGAWVSQVKEKTGATGKNLFMPLRKALTGMEHGPELANLLPLIGHDRAKARLGGEVK
jgi:glutamyl-tRNA synthetase